MIIEPQKDPMGQVILAYHQGDKKAKIAIETTLTEGEEMAGKYLFRKYKDFPLLEKEAMNLCKGQILDVGAGAGCHSLYLKEKGFDVKSIDISRLSVQVMQERGLNAHIQNVHNLGDDEKYDTILLMMNGIGIVGVLPNLAPFLQNIKRNLKPDGQILLDSSDLIYMFLDDDDSAVLDLNAEYYGEIRYVLTYKEFKSSFDWLFISFDILKDYAELNGFVCEKVCDGEHYDYLARLTVKK